MNDKPKIDPEACDEENPQLTAEEIRRARPASEVFGKERLDRILGRGPGRPPQGEEAKVSTTLRIDKEVLTAYKAAGKGWQTRINETLKAHMPARK
jgi:uncharacterized protein (DUF4415 family)